MPSYRYYVVVCGRRLCSFCSSRLATSVAAAVGGNVEREVFTASTVPAEAAATS